MITFYDFGIPASGGFGALVNQTGSAQALQTSVAMAWNAEVYDDTGWHDNSTNNSYLTVPSGVSLIRLVSNIGAAAATNTAVIDHRNNGSTFAGQGAATSLSTSDNYTNVASAIITVSSGDDLETWVDAGPGSVSLIDNFTWSSVETINTSLERALVAKTSNQSVTGGTTVTLTWDSETYDTDGFHDNVTNNSRLTAPATKRYRVAANLVCGSVAGQLVLSFFKDGATARGLASRDAEATAGEGVNAVSAPIEFTAGQYAEARAFHTNTVDILAGDSTWFAMEEVPSAHQCCLVYKSGNQSVSAATDTTLAWGAEVYDDDAMHDNTTDNSRIYVPTGMTKARPCFNIVTSSVSLVMSAWVTKNGSAYDGTPRDSTNTAGTDNLSGFGAWVDVTPGDYFECRFRSANATTIDTGNGNWFCLECQ